MFTHQLKASTACDGLFSKYLPSVFDGLLFVQVKAVYDYVTEVAGELCFNADDVLLITNQVFLHSLLSAFVLPCVHDK